MSQQRTSFRWPALALMVGVLAATVFLAACGSDEPGGLVTADPGLATESLPPASGTMPPPPPSADGGSDTPAPEVTDADADADADAGADGDPAEEAPTTNSVETTVLSPDEPCVTVATTIPGQRFCDGYDPFPTDNGDDPNNPAPCPPWATESAARPSTGWLGTDGTPLDYLSRSGVDNIGTDPALTALAQAADELLPPEYELESTSARGASACIEATLTLRASFRHSDGSKVIVLTDRLNGQYDWSQQPPSGSIERRSLDTGAELATGDYSNGLALRVWLAQPDGTLLRVIAFGANAPTFAGYPTTIPTQPTSVAPTPVPMTIDQMVDIALALAARG